MFEINEAVFYGVHGVCIVEDISKREFCGTVSDYYTLKPVYSNRSKVFVPVERAAGGIVMRKVLSKKEVMDIIDSLSDCENIWIEDASVRKEKFNDIIKNGTRSEVAMLIKTLYEHKLELSNENKKMHAADERIFAEAEKVLHEEFAYVLDIPREQVIDFITEKLNK